MMNNRDVIFDYIMQHGIDDYALKIMLRIRRRELTCRIPFFQCVEIGELGELLSYMCGCTVIMRRIEKRQTVTDKSMLCALVFNIVNRLPRPIKLCVATYKNCLVLVFKGKFTYVSNRFEQALFQKLQIGAAFLPGQEADTLILKLNKSDARPTAGISVEEMLLNPLSDAYVFLHNL